MAELPPFPREILNTAFNGDQRMITAFEALISDLQLALDTVENAGSAVTGIAATEFILAAANSALSNAKVLVQAGGITVSYGSGTATIYHPLTVTGGVATFILTADTSLILPTIGTVATTADIPAFFAALATTPSYADDAAAAVGGVPVGGVYRNGSVVQIRIT